MTDFNEIYSSIIPPEVLLSSYVRGIFPMSHEGEILWFSPEKRGVIPLDDRFHINHGLRRALKKKPYELTMNQAFADVMRGCAGRETTWIDETILESYQLLFELGFAHSVECWDDDGLQGGLYGVAIGSIFFGESMFSRKRDASKIALVHLVKWMRNEDFKHLDTQWMTDHLRSFGGYEIPRAEYMEILNEFIQSNR